MVRSTLVNAYAHTRMKNASSKDKGKPQWAQVWVGRIATGTLVLLLLGKKHEPVVVVTRKHDGKIKFSAGPFVLVLVQVAERDHKIDTVVLL